MKGREHSGGVPNACCGSVHGGDFAGRGAGAFNFRRISSRDTDNRSKKFRVSKRGAARNPQNPRPMYNPNIPEPRRPSMRPEGWSRWYVPLRFKFAGVQVLALLWVAVSVYISLPWLHALGRAVSMPAALIIIAGIAYVPGYMNALQLISLIWDRQPPLRDDDPAEAITLLIAAHNESEVIATTLEKVAAQDYAGPMTVMVIDNASTDDTAAVARKAGRQFGLQIRIVREATPGKHYALNRGLAEVRTKLVATLDADTLLHPQAIRRLVARYVSAPVGTGSVAGSVLVRNSRSNFLARMQEWDYFLGIASTKRFQGMYLNTLVAQGAFSLYVTDAVREAGGWPDAIGEDIVLTWKLLRQGQRSVFEPTAVAFTEVPTKFRHFSRQRSRWARGMLEGFRAVKPWEQPSPMARYLTGLDVLIPFMDLAYTFCWIPGLALACLGRFYIVGPATILVLPLTLAVNFTLYRRQRRVFESLGLRVRRNPTGLVAYVLLYQMMMSPVSVFGYAQELSRARRVWQ